MRYVLIWSEPYDSGYQTVRRGDLHDRRRQSNTTQPHRKPLIPHLTARGGFLYAPTAWHWDNSYDLAA